MALLLAAVIALIPPVIAPGSFFYFDVTPKVVLLLLGTAAAAVGWTAAPTCLTPAGFYRASLPARGFLLAICGMAVSLAVSTLASVNPLLSLGGSNWRYWGLVTQLAALGFAYLVATCCAGQPDRMRVLLRAIAASGLAVALYGIAQYFGWDPILDARGYHVGEGVWSIVRPPSTLGHADYSANWLLFVVFAAAALGVSESKAHWRWLAWAAVSAGSVAIVFSGTRAAMLGMLAGAVLLIFWWGRLFGRSIRLASLALAITAAATLFFVSPAGEKLRARVHWALQEPAGGARILLWRDSLRMAAGRLLAGYGPETFIASFARHQSADLSRAFPDFYHESPHNIFLDALVAQGVPGFVLLLALAATGFAAGIASRRGTGAHPAAGALVAGLAAMTISGQFACFTLPTALAYYVTVAMLVSLNTRRPVQPRPAAHRWPRLAVAIPCAAILVFFGVRLWIAESLLAAVRRDLDAALVGDAASRYAEYENWRWPYASADLWYSRRLAQIAGGKAAWVVRVQAFQQAFRAAQSATESTEAEFNAYDNLAAFYARQNDFLRTEQSLRSAISYAPNWFKAHWMLAQVLQAESRLKEAEDEAATAAALDGGKHPEVTGTLVNIRAAMGTASLKSPHK
ncbi:MAG: O-antigen ligase family protein [Bryobacteraceae bacterium]|jgi:O-antigen ligase